MTKKLYRHISLVGLGLYLAALAVISLLFKDYALQPKWMLWGTGEVLFFFVMTSVFYPRWKDNEQKTFLRKVFWVALAARVAYVVFTYYYFIALNRCPFEESGDSVGYFTRSLHLADLVRNGQLDAASDFLKGSTMGFSDQGYTIWLTLINLIFGIRTAGFNVMITRLLKALMSAYMCVAVYKLASRTCGERTGRLAAVMCAFTPILIQICGMHIKETEMIFLSVLALERMDYLIRSKRYTVWNILFPVLLTGMTFGFRTIIGMCLIFAFLAFVLLSSKDLVAKKGKIITLAATVVVFLVFLFSPIGREMKIIYRLRFTDLDYQSEKYEAMSLKHGELAKSWIMAPGAFVLPLAPMVDVAPDHNKMIHGSTYVTNFLAFFAMLALVVAFRQKKWRDFSLIGAYELSYLAIVMFSFTANSERFHEPAIPLLVLMAAYAMTHLRRKDLKLFYVYCGLLLIALVAWNWMKLSARSFV